MENIKILSARVGVTEGDFSCGPDFGVVVAEAQFEADGNEKFYISLAEVEGIPNVFKTDESTIDRQLDPDTDNEFFEELGGHYIAPGDYEEILGNKDSEYYDIFRYMIYLTRCENDEVEGYISATVGKNLDEIEIPASDIEEEMEG